MAITPEKPPVSTQPPTEPERRAARFRSGYGFRLSGEARLQAGTQPNAGPVLRLRRPVHLDRHRLRNLHDADRRIRILRTGVVLVVPRRRRPSGVHGRTCGRAAGLRLSAGRRGVSDHRADHREAVAGLANRMVAADRAHRRGHHGRGEHRPLRRRLVRRHVRGQHRRPALGARPDRARHRHQHRRGQGRRGAQQHRCGGGGYSASSRW